VFMPALFHPWDDLVIASVDFTFCPTWGYRRTVYCQSAAIVRDGADEDEVQMCCPTQEALLQFSLHGFGFLTPNGHLPIRDILEKAGLHAVPEVEPPN
jgi:hypothetical protein